MRDNSSVLFQLKLYMVFTKGAHQSAKRETFNCSGEISPNLYFDGLLLSKVYKISAKKVQRSYVSWYWRVMQNLKKSQFVFSKITKFWGIFIRELKSLKICTLIVPLCANYITFDLKKYRGVVFCDNEFSLKMWGKNNLLFGKWQEQFDKLSSKHLKVSKLVLSWNPFVQSRKWMS